MTAPEPIPSEEPPAQQAVALDYAQPTKRRRVIAWMMQHPFVVALVALAIGSGIGWKGYRWRLKEDEKAFDAVAQVNPRRGYIRFYKPPTPAALRHAERVAGIRGLHFDWSQEPSADSSRLLRGRKFPNVTVLEISDPLDADAWVKELSRPGSGLKALTTLDLSRTHLTDAGLKELARPDSGLKALTALDLSGTQVTDAGLKELARSDSGLKALMAVDVSFTPVTDEGIAALRKVKRGMAVRRDFILPAVN